MIGKSWRIILLIVAIAAMIWPGIIGSSTMYVGLAALVILLIAELTCKDCMSSMSSPSMAMPKKKRTAKKRKRR